MRWTIALQFDDGAGNAQTAEVLTLEREIDPPFAMLGLLNREAKTLLLRLQERFVGQQGAAYSRRIRPCPKCGINRRIKDYRPRTLRSPAQGPQHLGNPHVTFGEGRTAHIGGSRYASDILGLTNHASNIPGRRQASQRYSPYASSGWERARFGKNSCRISNLAHQSH